jgi:hypothetical protein
VPALGYINQAAYLLMVAYWSRVAWRTEMPSRIARPGSPDEPDTGTHSLTRLAAG